MITVFLAVIFPLFSIEEKCSGFSLSFLTVDVGPLFCMIARESGFFWLLSMFHKLHFSQGWKGVTLTVYFSLALSDSPQLFYFLYKLCHQADHLPGHTTCRCPLFCPQILMPGSNTPCSLRKRRAGRLHVSERTPSASPRSFQRRLSTMWKSSLGMF